LALSLAAGGVAEASSVTFSPAPAVAGQPIVVTFESVAFACDTEGLLQLQNVNGHNINLTLTPPNCPIIPVGFIEYTASVTIGPLAAGTYAVVISELAGGISVLQAYETLEVKEPPVCNATNTALCLDGRFEVTAEWTDFDHRHGAAHTLPDDLGGLGDSGVLWFFSQDNPEILVKILNACSVNGHYWVFLSPGSNVMYDVRVFDVRTGTRKTYSNPLGTIPKLTPDTKAFPCS